MDESAYLCKLNLSEIVNYFLNSLNLENFLIIINVEVTIGKIIVKRELKKNPVWFSWCWRIC